MSLFRITIDMVDTAGYNDPETAAREVLQAMCEVEERDDWYFLEAKVEPAKFVVPAESS